jgi:hypothetical protein
MIDRTGELYSVTHVTKHHITYLVLSSQINLGVFEHSILKCSSDDAPVILHISESGIRCWCKKIA